MSRSVDVVVIGGGSRDTAARDLKHRSFKGRLRPVIAWVVAPGSG